MKINILILTLLIAKTSLASDLKDWSYAGETGPENWASINSENYACSGKNQSPINLSVFTEADSTPITFNYTNSGNEIVNNGHTVQINHTPGSFIELDGKIFELLQLHFHTPSENHINGVSYPLEAHLVHSDPKGNLAVIAVMYEQGTENQQLKAPWSQMPQHPNEIILLSTWLNAESLLPDNRAYYRFNGSLTTPPCTEGVRWLVLKKPLQVSAKQIKRLMESLGGPNNRPLQPVNARSVLQ